MPLRQGVRDPKSPSNLASYGSPENVCPLSEGSHLLRVAVVEVRRLGEIAVLVRVSFIFSIGLDKERFYRFDAASR